jgi:hypothetical protein
VNAHSLHPTGTSPIWETSPRLIQQLADATLGTRQHTFIFDHWAIVSGALEAGELDVMTEPNDGNSCEHELQNPVVTDDGQETDEYECALCHARFRKPDIGYNEV